MGDYCVNCGNKLDKSYFVCMSCLKTIDDHVLRTNDAERVLLGLSGVCTLTANIERSLDKWEVARIERIRNRGRYGFHSAKVVVVRSMRPPQADIPLEIDIYAGLFDVQEELDELQLEESENYLAIVAAPNWFMTLAFATDYTDEHCDLPYSIAKALGGSVVYENGGLEPEFRKASELTDLMFGYDLWNYDSDLLPKSRKAQKAFDRDEYSVGTVTYVREDGSEATLTLHAQIFTRNESVQVDSPLQSSKVKLLGSGWAVDEGQTTSQAKLIGNGWMVTVVGSSEDEDIIEQYALDAEEYLGCETQEVFD